MGELVTQESLSIVVATWSSMVTTLMLGLKVKWPASVTQSAEHSITDHEIEGLNLGTKKNCQRKKINRRQFFVQTRQGGLEQQGVIEYRSL
jgi:hypothetical protein